MQAKCDLPSGGQLVQTTSAEIFLVGSVESGNTFVSLK